MADLVRIGKIVINLAFVQHIFEDPDTPGTWVIIMDTPMASGKSVGTKAVRAINFTGEEAAALKWYVDNFIHDITQAHGLFLKSPKNRKDPTQAQRAIGVHWDEADE